MTALDANTLRACISGAALKDLARLDVFTEIESTNSYLMQSDAPPPRKMCIAATTNQTAGRGRQGKRWQSPAGSGLCLSAAYTYATQPKDLSALTLAIGLTAINTLEVLGVNDVQLKWPNDLVARDGKLGGILTESQQHSNSSVTVVTGIGINIDVPDTLTSSTNNGWATGIVDLAKISDAPPAATELAGAMSTLLHRTFSQFVADGFAPFVKRWSARDWLFGRPVTMDIGGENISGVAAGIAENGALLLDDSSGKRREITAGSIVAVGEKSAVA